MKRVRSIFLVIFLMLLLNTTGCVPVIYEHHHLEYEPIDAIDIYRIPIRHPEVVYIPRYKPRHLYQYNNFWYDEPYTRMLYMDLQGRVAPRKIPNSQLPKERPIQPIKRKRIKKPDIRVPVLPKNRKIIRRRIRNRWAE